MKKTLKLISCLCLMLLTLHFPEVKAAEITYNLFPTPHNLTYLDGTSTLSDNINIVKKAGVQDATVNKLKEVLKKTNITVSENVVENKQNVILALDTTDTTFTDNQATIPTEGFDAYTLVVKDNKIAIAGKTDNAVFFGIETLALMLEQNATLRNVLIKDYADVKYRGFIEGYYGIPWSHENRISLMQFGGRFKANTYIFAPKDDIYHSSHWKDLYPETELSKIKELAKVGNETRTKFVWTIHPFMSQARFNFGNYDTDLATLLSKFDQLYTNGVRQFGILADDVGSISRTDLLKMLKDVSNWAKDKGDVEDILFCPAGYNHAWQRDYAELKKLNEAPDNIQFFWTGETVVNKISQETVNHFKNNSTTTDHPGRNPFFWLNWPVNDYKKSRLLMGPATALLEPGVQNLSGVVTNPMQQAQASKVGIFATVDYAWNTHDFNATKNWENAFSAIDTAAPEALKEIAKHLQDVSPSGHNLQLDESTELAPFISHLATAIEGGNKETIKTEGQRLITELDKITQAVTTYKASASNKVLVTEMTPWLNSLYDLAMGTKSYVTALITEDKNERWTAFEAGTSYSQRSKQYTVKNISSIDIVEAGNKRLVPLNTGLGKILDQLIYPGIAENAPLSSTGFYSTDLLQIRQNNMDALTDGKDSTYVTFSSKNGNYTDASGYVGVELNRPVELDTITIKQSRPSATGDHFGNAIIEYSLDGTNYQTLQEVGAENDIHIKVANNVKAKYVRLRNKERVEVWTSFKDFSVTERKNIKVISNVEVLKTAETTTGEDVFKLVNKTVTLNPNEYIGIDLLKIREFKEIAAANGLTLEYSKNDVVYHNIAKPYETARYVRLINKTDKPITTEAFINTTTVEYKPITLSDTNYADYEGLSAAFDGDTDTSAWFKNSQHAGKYLTYDLGQEIDLTSIQMVVRDSEHDYVRHGKISVSRDNKTWEEVLAIDATNDEEIMTAFPEHYISLNYKGNKFAVKKARYLKFEVTKNKSGADKWVRFQEIILNDGKYIPSVNTPQITVTNDETIYNKKEFVGDHALTTAYTTKNPGELVYYIDHPSKFKAIQILTSGEQATNVMIMNEKEEWIDKGSLDSTYKTINVGDSEHVLAVKLTWAQGSRNIHEIIFDNNVVIEDFNAKVKGIQVKADKSIVDSTKSLSVKEVEKTIENAKVKAYDIKILDENGEKVTFTGEVEVKMPVPEDFDITKVEVFHENDTTPTPHTVDGNHVVFKAKSFSVYYLKQNVSSDENTPETEGKPNEKQEEATPKVESEVEKQNEEMQKPKVELEANPQETPRVDSEDANRVTPESNDSNTPTLQQDNMIKNDTKAENKAPVSTNATDNILYVLLGIVCLLIIVQQLNNKK